MLQLDTPISFGYLVLAKAHFTSKKREKTGGCARANALKMLSCTFVQL